MRWWMPASRRIVPFALLRQPDVVDRPMALQVAAVVEVVGSQPCQGAAACRGQTTGPTTLGEHVARRKATRSMRHPSSGREHERVDQRCDIAGAHVLDGSVALFGGAAPTIILLRRRPAGAVLQRLAWRG